MDLQFIYDLELLYERGLAEKDLSDFDLVQRKFLSFLNLLEQRNFLQFYKTGNLLLARAENATEKAFILSWLIVGCERQYDLNLRLICLDQLEEISQSEFNLYSEFLKIYFKSISHFFAAEIDVSELLIAKALGLAKTLGCVRGEARCLYHQALIFNETQRVLEFKRSFQKCIEVSSNHLLLKLKQRALNVLFKSDAPAGSIEDFIERTKMAILNSDAKYGRLLLCKAEVLRRQHHINRQRYSLYFFRAQILVLSKQISYARRFLSSLKDPVLRLDLLKFMQSHGITLLQTEINFMKRMQIRLQVGEAASTNSINLSLIQNETVQKLLRTLSDSGPLEKEKLFEAVYGITYDPVIHDSKLYKLILKAKKEISSDLIINTYGKYHFNSQKFTLVS